MRRLLPLLVLSVLVLGAATAVSGARTRSRDACATPIYENGLDVVFGRARARAAADRITHHAQLIGFAGVRTVRASCTQWESVLRGLASFDTAVSLQAEARRARVFATIECQRAQEVGQLQAVFATRATAGEIGAVIDRARSFGYVGLKTKRAPCGGYQAYVAGFTSTAQAWDFAATASRRTGFRVVVIKA